MKMQLTRRNITTSLAILAVLLISIFTLRAEDAHKKQEGHQGAHATDADKAQKVRCAVDGMMMKPAAMIKVEHDGKTYYFCNDMQVEMFKANPDKYLQTISIGNLTFDLNVITIDAYKMMMSHMGMGSMIKADEIKGKTHYFSIYPMHDHGEIALGDVKLAIQVTNTKGETKMTLLKYSKMTHTYAGFMTMPEGTEHEVRVRVTSPAVKISL